MATTLSNGQRNPIMAHLTDLESWTTLTPKMLANAPKRGAKLLLL